MAEFAGYIGSQVPPMDWSKITSDYTNKLISLNEQRKAEQEKIDDMEADALAKVGDIEITSSQPFNNFFLDTVDNYKQSIYMKSQLVKKGLLSKQDFRKSLITASSNTSILNKFAKTYQEQATMLTKAAAENKLGKYGLKMAERFGSFQNIGNRKSYIDPNSDGLFIADVDPETGSVKSKDNISSILTIANPANSYVPRVDLNSSIKGIKDILGSKGLIVTNPDGSSYVSDSVKNLPEYKSIINSQASAIATTPNEIVNILSDYGGYETYFNEAEKKQYLDEGIKEDKLIFVAQRENLFVPQLTDAQKGAARDIVAQNIDASLSDKITGYKAAPQAKEQTEAEKITEATALVSQEGWQDMLAKGRDSKFKDEVLQMSGLLEFKNGDVVPITDENGTNMGFKIYSNDGRKVKEITSQKDFYDFINYNPEKPIQSKVNRKLAEDQAKKSGKYITLSEIKNMTPEQRQGLSVTEYMKALQSKNFLIGEE
jgi:hypothetical protein